MSLNGLAYSIQRLIDGQVERRSSQFQHLRQQMHDVSGDGGILKQVVQPGEGPLIPNDASVSMHFSGFLEHSQEPFETTKYRKHPRTMKLGRDVTLAGLELGLLTMRKGEFSRFLFQPQYAYGDLGCAPHIPGAAVVLYEVQIVDFLDSGHVDDFTSMSPARQAAAPLSALLEVVNTVRSFGNRCFNQSRYEDAKYRYKQAVKLLTNRRRESDAATARIAAALLPLYLNLSLTELRLDSPGKALKYGKQALSIEAANTKALFRCGQAHLELCEFEDAHRCLVAAQAKRPFDSDINSLLREVATCYKDSLDKEKDMCSKMFNDLRIK